MSRLVVIGGGVSGLAAALLAAFFVWGAAAAGFFTGPGADAERTRSGWQVFLWLNYFVGFLVTPALIGMVTL